MGVGTVTRGFGAETFQRINIYLPSYGAAKDASACHFPFFYADRTSVCLLLTGFHDNGICVFRARAIHGRLMLI